MINPHHKNACLVHPIFHVYFIAFRMHVQANPPYKVFFFVTLCGKPKLKNLSDVVLEDHYNIDWQTPILIDHCVRGLVSWALCCYRVRRYGDCFIHKPRPMTMKIQGSSKIIQKLYCSPSLVSNVWETYWWKVGMGVEIIMKVKGLWGS